MIVLAGNMLAKVRSVLSQVTVEPAMFLFMFAHDFQSTAGSALWYDQTCRSLYGQGWICNNIRTNDTLSYEENEVQKVRKAQLVVTAR